MDKLITFIMGLSEEDVEKLVKALPHLDDLIKAEAERENDGKDN